MVHALLAKRLGVNILVFCICRLTASLVARRIIISGSTSFPSAPTSAKSDGHELHPFRDCRENQVVVQLWQNLAFRQKKNVSHTVVSVRNCSFLSRKHRLVFPS